MWELAPYCGTHEGADESFSCQELASKYLTGLIVWSILLGGNHDPKNELRQ